MKVVTYVVGNGKPRVGMLENSSVVDIGFDGDMVAFIEAGAPIGKQTHVENARLLAPLRPRSLRDFLTFEGHMHNALTRLGRPIPQEWYTVPAYYKGMPDTVIGPDEEIPWPAYTNRLDHELELAAIIGRKGKDISKADAPGYVFGYTIWNDMSARDVQTRELPIGMGPAKAKDWDGSNVLGPCIVTADALDASNGGYFGTHAPYVRRLDLVCIAGANALSRRCLWLGHGRWRLWSGTGSPVERGRHRRNGDRGHRHTP